MTSPSRTIAAAIPTLSARDGSIERELNKNTIEFVYSVQPHTDLNNHGYRIPYSIFCTQYCIWYILCWNIGCVTNYQLKPIILSVTSW